jgi:hypothetical protein
MGWTHSTRPRAAVTASAGLAPASAAAASMAATTATAMAPPTPAAAERSQPQQPPPQHPEDEVPSTLPDLLRTFFTQTSILGATATIAATATARVSLPAPATPTALAAELALALSAAALWSLSEHAIHRHLLHPTTTSEDGSHKPLDPVREALRTIHEQHHQRPYLHVSVDGPLLITGFMLGTGVMWVLGFAAVGWVVGGGGVGVGGGIGGVGGGLTEAVSAMGAAASLSSSAFLAATTTRNPLLLTCLASYWSSGLLYELVHFAVHTRYVPKGKSWPASYLRAVRRHHILHHCRSEEHWLAFTVPQVDALFGTLPGGEGKGLPPITPMARRAAAAWKQERRA